MNLGPPPANADEQETPVAEKLRGFAFEGVANELEDPSDDKQSESVEPEPMNEDASNEDWEREQDGWDAQRVADAVYGMLMAGGVLGNPLLVSAVA